MATIIQVSQLSGVSKSTVSRVVAGNGSVSPKTRQKVEAAIAELGYRPNNVARSLKNNRSDMIGVVVVDISSPFYAQLLKGVQNVFQSLNKDLIVASGFGQKDKEIKAVSSLLDRRCDGLILFLESDIGADELAQLDHTGIPVVLIGRENIPFPCSSVRVDNEHGGYMAAKHLIDMGHESLVHLAGPQYFRDGRARLQGFWRAIDEAGISRNQCHVVYGDYSDESGYELTKTLLKQKVVFTGLCSGDDDMAAGAYQALREEGKRIPEDVSVIGYDDNFHARLMYPPLTTIRQPIIEMGHTAADMLVELFQETDEHHLVLTPELLDRGSIKNLKK